MAACRVASGPCGGSPVFQSTTVAPPSGSANTASMRPRTTVSPMAISNGTSTSTAVRPAHGDARKGARTGQGAEVEQPLGAVEPLDPLVKCIAQQRMRVWPLRQPTGQPLHSVLGLASQGDQAADRQLT